LGVHQNGARTYAKTDTTAAAVARKRSVGLGPLAKNAACGAEGRGWARSDSTRARASAAKPTEWPLMLCAGIGTGGEGEVVSTRKCGSANCAHVRTIGFCARRLPENSGHYFPNAGASDLRVSGLGAGQNRSKRALIFAWSAFSAVPFSAYFTRSLVTAKTAFHGP